MSAPLLEEWLLAQLDRSNTLPLQQQLYRALRSALLERRLAAGTRLPSSRTLATQISVARNTVLAAYEQLQAEGYVSSRHGAGCFVSDQLPDAQTRAEGRTAAPLPADTAPAQLSARCQRSIDAARLPPRRSAGAFVPATPDLRNFPFEDWHRLVHKYERQAPWQWFDYVRGAGLPALKEAIAAHVQIARAVRCEPQQVLITNATHQAFDLCFRGLADAGATVAAEEPGYLGARAAALAADLQWSPVPVDPEGIRVDAIPATASLIYVTPSHQYPMGPVMSLQRREQLLQHARQHQAYILEDDYDSELRYNGRPLASLQGLDEHQRVFYLGTFSKMLFPAIRLAYVIVPPAWVAPMTRLHDQLCALGNLPVQAALAEFISSGKLASHIRRLRVTYAERNALLKELLQPMLARGWKMSGGEAGLHLVMLAPTPVDDVAIAKAAFERNIMLRPLSLHYAGENKQTGFILGYSAADARELKNGMRILLELLP